MPDALSISDDLGASFIREHSQIANINATPEFRKNGNDANCVISHCAYMDESDNKNGGPNHLHAWMKHRGVKGVELAKALGGTVTPGMVSDLANSNRALSAKWLRRIAPILDTTPGMLLDHDPTILDADVIEMWGSASQRQKAQIANIAKTLLASDDDLTGTDD